MTAILISRFLLNLQAVNQSSLKLARDDPLYSSQMNTGAGGEQGLGSLVFSGFDMVGSLGESIALGEHAWAGDGEIREGDSVERGVENASVERDVLE